METTESKVLKIFYCYARKDKPLRDEMDLHLSALKWQNSIVTWADHEIAPGEDWKKDIDRHLNDADIIFLLVSPNFMGSDYCYGIEMRRALERHEQKQARVVPIILRPVDWEGAPFSKLQVLPTNAQPVTSWPDLDAAFADIVKNLRPMIKDLRNRLKTKEDWLAEAEALIAQDAHRDALGALDQALALDPGYVLALIYRGGAYKQLSDYQKAIIDFDHALSLDPKNSTLLMLRGDAYRLQGKYPEALADLNHSLALNPVYPAALARRGETHRIMGNYEKALVDLDQAIEFEPDDTFALAARGDTHRFIGNYQQALADFNHVLSLSPPNATILTKRGDTYHALKDYKKALNDFNEALTLNSNFSTALARRGETYRLSGEYEKALADLNKALDSKPDNAWALIARGEIYQAKGQFAEALSDFTRAITLEEDDWYYYKLATTYFLIDEKGAHERVLKRAIRLAQSRLANANSTSERWGIAFNMALYYLFLGKSETAEALYENLVSVCTLPHWLQNAADDLLEIPRNPEGSFTLIHVDWPLSKSPVQVERAEFQRTLIDRLQKHILKRMSEIKQATS
jgi:tetratricopeptide (TPR) repeat protein